MITHFDKKRLQTPFGFIDYIYSNDILVFMGSYVEKEFRGKGIYKQMVKELLLMFPEGTLIQVPIENKVLKSMFKRIGFNKVKSIEYWGKLGNATLMESILTKEMINMI